MTLSYPAPDGPSFQNAPLTADTVASGELQQRLNPTVYPQQGVVTPVAGNPDSPAALPVAAASPTVPLMVLCDTQLATDVPSSGPGVLMGGMLTRYDASFNMDRSAYGLGVAAGKTNGQVGIETHRQNIDVSYEMWPVTGTDTMTFYLGDVNHLGDCVTVTVGAATITTRLGTGPDLVAGSYPAPAIPNADLPFRRLRLRLVGNHVTVTVNGTTVLDADLPADTIIGTRASIEWAMSGTHGLTHGRLHRLTMLESATAAAPVPPAPAAPTVFFRQTFQGTTGNTAIPDAEVGSAFVATSPANVTCDPVGLRFLGGDWLTAQVGLPGFIGFDITYVLDETPSSWGSAPMPNIYIGQDSTNQIMWTPGVNTQASVTVNGAYTYRTSYDGGTTNWSTLHSTPPTNGQWMFRLRVAQHDQRLTAYVNGDMVIDRTGLVLPRIDNTFQIQAVAASNSPDTRVVSFEVAPLQDA